MGPRRVRPQGPAQTGSFEFRDDLLADLEGGEADGRADGCDQASGIRTPGDQYPDRVAGSVGDQSPPAGMNGHHLVAIRAGDQDRDAVRRSNRGDSSRIPGPGRIRGGLVGDACVDDVDPMDLPWRAQGRTWNHLGGETVDVGSEPLRRGLQGTVSRAAQIEPAALRPDGGREGMGEPKRLQER